MKNICISLILFFLSCDMSAQPWFDVGIKTSYNSSWLINQNVIKDPAVSYIPSYGYMGGIKLGYNFNSQHELNTEFLYSSVNQKYQDNLSSEDWLRNINLTYFEIPLLYRHNNNGSYAEAGPQFSALMSARESSWSNNNANVNNYFQSSDVSGVFGFGAAIAGVNNTSIMLGVRIVYGFLDITSSRGGKDQPYPYPAYPGYFNNASSATLYKATNTLSGGFVLEINYDLGYFVTSSCKRNTKFLLFNRKD